MNTKDYDDLILGHYKKIAANFKDLSTSSMEDRFVREKEIEFILTELTREYSLQQTELKVLDVGCGNGYTLSEIKNHFPFFKLYGVEFTPELFEIAIARNLAGVEIFNRDARKADFFDDTVDVAITERVIINILNKKDQETAIINIASRIKIGGLYIMIESFKEPLVQLNLARDEMSLTPIPESYQNIYLSEFFVGRIKKYGLEEITPVMPSNYLSSHFFNSRIIHNAIRPEGGKVKHTRFVSFLDQAVPPAIGNYSPILFRIFRKV